MSIGVQLQLASSQLQLVCMPAAGHGPRCTRGCDGLFIIGCTLGVTRGCWQYYKTLRLLDGGLGPIGELSKRVGHDDYIDLVVWFNDMTMIRKCAQAVPPGPPRARGRNGLCVTRIRSFITSKYENHLLKSVTGPALVRPPCQAKRRVNMGIGSKSCNWTQSTW